MIDARCRWIVRNESRLSVGDRITCVPAAVGCISSDCSPTARCIVRSIISKRLSMSVCGVGAVLHRRVSGWARYGATQCRTVYRANLHGYRRARQRSADQRICGRFLRWIATSAGNASNGRTRCWRADKRRSLRRPRSAALEAAYQRGENDEFVLPTIVGEPRPVREGDAVIFFNFRPDRGARTHARFRAPRRSSISRRRANRNWSSRR